METKNSQNGHVFDIPIRKDTQTERDREVSRLFFFTKRSCCDVYVTECYALTPILIPTAAIDLVDEAAAKLKMEITSKPTALDEINRSVLKLEMERLSLTNDTDKASKDRLSRLEAELAVLKEKQAQLNEQWEHEKTVMTRLQSIKEEVCHSY